VRVVGTCHDSIGINDFADLKSVAASAVIKALNGSPVFWIVGSHVQVKNPTVDGGLFGVMCREFSVLPLQREHHPERYRQRYPNRQCGRDLQPNVIQNNANSRLNLTASRVGVSQVTAKSTTAGSWGFGNGVDIELGSTLTVEQKSALWISPGARNR
jgi:hypothetical protein